MAFQLMNQVKRTIIIKLIKAINYIKLLWFSRTIGPDRGIEFLLKALLIYEIPVELHLLGEMTAGYQEFLEKSFPYQNSTS